MNQFFGVGNHATARGSLAARVKNMSPHPVAAGTFSDLHTADLVEGSGRNMKSVRVAVKRIRIMGGGLVKCQAVSGIG